VPRADGAARLVACTSRTVHFLNWIARRRAVAGLRAGRLSIPDANKNPRPK